MDPLALALIELGAVVFCLGLLARLAGKIGMSPIPLYLVGGLAFGAGGLVKLDGMHEFAHLSGEMGVILLLLMLGLEYTASELVTGLRRSWQAGVMDFVLNFLPGAGLAVLLGWGLVGAIVMGGVTYISSSGIAAKVITDLGRIGNRETPVVLSILVFEDLAMAIYLPILTAILAGVGFLGGLQTVGIALAVVTVVLVIALKHGHRVSQAIHSENSEVFLLNVLGLALLVAGIASALQVSAAVGAFMLGIAISGATAHNATRILEPLRDLFAAIFFVAFGLNTDPTSIPPVLGWALLLAVLTAATKMLTGIWAAKRAGIAMPGRFRAGAALIARGEFSIVIAGLAVASGAVPGELAALATAYVLIMAIVGPLAARFVEPVVKAIRRTPKAPPRTTDRAPA
ncbi:MULTISPECIES: cation:proton antiporter [Paenarthrobacter]|jgi:CPA2 family monovalent cation:H+ antiporter-2|uniref:CPA2 family monovalent cation:H+ antiporter-2 n=1 Tax=Paenarthrobacter nicotinovorans TaxID=29320 RepID=A0ABT9TUI8_PAENI|nr:MULTISPECIES: cation:proton antiporter [Paenarthrobacter]KIA71453.1 K(+)/H(+) antiporter YhaU [Arthrobacter sp. MWB30]KQR06964.1 potassium transporter [Arthrobacter sp. Leaf145]SKB76413.1 potassium/proton antiporter membrane subunit, CPA2 family [Arthrobacter sp. 31Cvi3.1E]BCW12325.1 monovalent cation:H+ antiporter-2, CPA2 family protein [Arthrobacter sp. NtRootA2]BCW16407.1 monovalent cation:H+ antiporter-2, CPA2 family protein [Arthrobacter sp. NtRootA4]BCW24740.1 monovalent cation:H+ an